MADSSLRREVHDTGKAVFLEQARDALAIGKVESDEAHLIGFCKLRTTRFLQRRIVIVIHAIDANDVAAVAQETLRDVKADKPGCAGYENRALSHRLRPEACRRLEPPQINSVRLFCTVEFRLYVQHNSLAFLKQLGDQRPPARCIFFVGNGKDDRIGSR